MALAVKMSSLKKLIFFLSISFLASCSTVVSNEWTQFVPDETPFIIIPERGASIQTVLNSKYLPLLDDVSSSSIQLIKKIDSTAVNAIQLKSILLYPGIDQKLQPIWVAKAPSDFLEHMQNSYEELYGQQYYYFNEIPVLKLRTGQRMFYASRINNLLLLSESSLGIENAIRVYRGQQPGAQLGETPLKPGSLIMNTPALDEWITQQAKVIYYPNIQHSFSGTGAATLTVAQKDTTVGGGIKLTGKIPVDDKPRSTLIKGLSSQNAPLSLGKFVSFDAAAFALFRLPPLKGFPETIADTASADSFFIDNTDVYEQIGQTLGDELAMVMFAKSGFRSINEHAFIRKIAQPTELQSILNSLVEKNILRKVEDSYFVRSSSLCLLLGSKLCNLNNFYVQVEDSALIMAARRGLVELIVSDYQRRQVIIYEPFFKKIKTNLPGQISGLVVGGKDLFTYLKPFLKKESYVSALTSMADYITVSTRKEGAGVNFTLATYNIETEEKPYIENWVFPVDSPLTGAPVYADILGSANKEIIFATASGSINVVAADGTLIQTYSTGNEIPVGSPVAYDWYNTGQKVVMVAAGNKIFAWDESGNSLPQFPFTLNEKITTPLAVSDLNGNGLADIIVATANRKLHILNARGEPLFGWPVRTNTIVNDKPLITHFRGQPAIAAFAANTIHLWNITGRSFSGFPYFINASFTGSPVQLGDEVLGAAADGTLYAFGESNLFDNSLNSTNIQYFNNGNVEKLAVSNRPLFNSPFTSSDSKIALMNVNGTIYLFSKEGNLLLAKSMGQAPAKEWEPVIVDIDNDERLDVVALAAYGRLYAWDIETGERIHDLPTEALSHVNIGDIDGDGLMEIVGQSEAGIHSWTIN